MNAGWNADPSGRHAERFWDGSRFTSRVRDMGVESIDAVGEDPAPHTTLGSPGDFTGSFSPSATTTATPHAFAPVAPVAAPPTFTPTTPSPYGSTPTGPPLAPAVHPPHARKGLPGFLVLSIMIASFPAFISFGTGFWAMIVGNQISSASSSYSGDTWGSTFDDFGSATTSTGFVMFILGIGAMIGLIATGRGSNAGRITTAVWMSGLVLLMLAGLSQTPGGGDGTAVFMIGIPILGIAGLFTPMSNEVFRKDSPFG